MNKGRWAIVIVVLVALGMGIATWPLLRIRRKNEIHRTQAVLEGLRSACEHYRVRHGRFPESLEALESRVPLEYLDAWRRPIRYEVDAGKPKLWSLGPNAEDPSDDIAVPR